MPYKPLPVHSFGGLRLDADPSDLGWSGAASVQNVEFDLNGSARSRPGYDQLDATTTAGTALGLHRIRNTTHYFLVTSSNYTAFNSSFVDIESASHSADPTGSAVEWNAVLFFADTTDVLSYWSLSLGLNTLASSPRCHYLTIAPWSNRLVCARSALAAAPIASRVFFSDPGAMTFPSGNWVDLHPNDGQTIRQAVAWREMVFVFKDAKFAVFYTNTVDSTGEADFSDYNMVDTGVGCAYDHAACAAADGVYFVNADGIWRTAGGTPELVSQALQPFFDGRTHPIFTPTGPLSTPRINADAERLYVWQKGATGMFVMDLRSRVWTYWVLTTAPHTLLTMDDPREFLWTNSTGQLHKFSPDYTDDDGTAITSHRTTGFQELAEGHSARIRRFTLEGTGTVTHTLYGDHSVAAEWQGTAASSVAMGASKSRQYAHQSGRARALASKVSATGAWSMDRWTAWLADVRSY